MAIYGNIATAQLNPVMTSLQNGMAFPPPPTIESRQFWDDLVSREVSFGLWWDPNAGYFGVDCTAKLQQVLAWLGTFAKSWAQTNIANAVPFNRQYVILTLPKGAYIISSQIVIPEFVALNCLGTIYCGPGGTLQNNIYIPPIVFVPYSHCLKLELQCNFYTGGVQYQCNGVVFGQTYSPSSFTIQNGGASHKVNDVVTLQNQSIYTNGSYVASQVTINSVDSNGKALTGTLSTAGIFSSQPTSLPQSSTTGKGTGLVITPNWAAQFSGGAYNPGTPIPANTIANDLNIFGTGYGFSATYGSQTACYMSTQNANVGRITTNGGLYGVYFPAGCFDLHCEFINTVLPYVGLYVSGNGFDAYHKADSCLQSVCVVAGAADVDVRGYGFYNNGNNAFLPGGANPGCSSYPLIIQATVFQSFNVRLKYDTHNIGNGSSTKQLISLAGCDNVKVQATGSNLDQGGGAAACTLAGFCNYGSSLGTNISISGQLGSCGNSLLTGSPVGQIDVWDDDIPDGNGGTLAGRLLSGPIGIYNIVSGSAPVNGSSGTGHGKTPINSSLFYNGTPYLNTGSTASPTWTKYSAI